MAPAPDPALQPIPARVFGSLVAGEVRIVLLPEVGHAGGATRDLPLELVPRDCRMPNTNLWVRLNAKFEVAHVWRREDVTQRDAGELIEACKAGDLLRVSEALDVTSAAWKLAAPVLDAPLIVAIKAGHADVVALLLQAGAPANAQYGPGATPLHEVLHAELENEPLVNGERGGSLTMTRMLLAAGANPTAAVTDGTTPIGLANLYRSPATVRLLKAYTAA